MYNYVTSLSWSENEKRFYKSCTEGTHIFTLNNFITENRPFYGIMWENMLEPDMPQMTMEHALSMLDN